jgi:hypothetical protein
MDTTEIPRQPDRLADDLLDGAAAIASYIGKTRRETYWVIQQGQIPAGRLGRKIIGSKRALDRHMTKITRGATA